VVPNGASSRRSVLQAIAVGGVTGITGCNTSGNRSTSTPSDSHSPTTRHNRHPPKISIETDATHNAGELQIAIEATDDNALEEVILALNGEELRRDSFPDNEQGTYQTMITAADTDAVNPGQMNRVRTTISDTAGNSAEEVIEQYVRKYDVRNGTQLDIGVTYVPFIESKWGECMPLEYAEPRIGHYEMDDAEAMNRHIDQMQGYGIWPVMLNFNGTPHAKRQIREFTAASLVSEIPVEPKYTMDALRWNRDEELRAVLADDFAFVRDQLFTNDDVTVYEEEGRPTFYFWGVDYLAWEGSEESLAMMDQVMDEWGSYEEFVKFIRTQLTVDGQTPYLIGEVRDSIGMTDKEKRLDQQFDAITTWAGQLEEGETMSWEDVLGYFEENFTASREFAEKHDIEFIPNVIPGFNDTENSCWGQDFHVPRSVDGFRRALELADQYRTIDRINVATWNDWTEGTQIEPGSFQGNDYGTNYLEEVTELQDRG